MKLYKHTITTSVSDEEFAEIISDIKNLYDFDFSNYAEASLKRQFSKWMNQHHLSAFELRNNLVNDPGYFERFLCKITLNVTEMFRDPEFYGAIRELVLPYLKSYQRLNIWHAGCSTGEELYSFSILFEEEGLYERSYFYGTDINPEVLKIAKHGIYSLQKMKQYAENFKKTGSLNSLAKFYTSKYDAASIKHSLKKNAVFSTHNLVSDGVFNEFQVIVCRNVLIYFNKELQDQVLKLFYKSLSNFGFLCLGSKETIRHPELKKKFKVIDKKNNIYQKIIHSNGTH